MFLVDLLVRSSCKACALTLRAVPSDAPDREDDVADARLRDAVRLRVRRVVSAALRVFWTDGALRVCRDPARREQPDHHRQRDSQTRSQRLQRTAERHTPEPERQRVRNN